jgi:hypothetical protein
MEIEKTISIPPYPDSVSLDIRMRPVLHPRFANLQDGVSEFTFACMYLFRKTHEYRVSRLDELFLFTGSDAGTPFFMLPFGLPDKETITLLFNTYSCMKAVTERQVPFIEAMGFRVTEDRENFDYLYDKQALATLSGRKYHSKKNLVNLFTRSNSYEGKPLLDEYIGDALGIVDEWCKNRDDPGDYEAAREALLMNEELVLCGGIYYVNGRPAAYTLGEEISARDMFVIHFEKAVVGFRGLYQFINMSFASILPDKYLLINREQDLGDEGLRKAKLSYKPVGFVRKYRAYRH